MIFIDIFGDPVSLPLNTFAGQFAFFAVVIVPLLIGFGALLFLLMLFKAAFLDR